MRLCGKQDWPTDALAFICTAEFQSCVEHWITTWHAFRHVHHSSPVGAAWTRCAAARVNAHAVISIHTESCNKIQWKTKLSKWFTTNLGCSVVGLTRQWIYYLNFISIYNICYVKWYAKQIWWTPHIFICSKWFCLCTNLLKCQE